MTRHHVLWASPQPLWGRFLAETGGASFASADQARPAILGFTTDEFMDQLLAMLAAEPRRLGETLARPETWRTPLGDSPDLVERVALPRLARTLAKFRKGRLPVGTVAPTSPEQTVTENTVTRTLPLKLYHPAHQRHYVVAANLVCGLPGFPDRAVDTGSEQIGFVIRRLLPGSGDSLEEYAFLKGGGQTRWQRVPADPQAADPYARLADGEEILPLFPLTFRDDTDHPRRLLAGVVPVGRRDEYMGTRADRTAPPPAGSAPAAPGTAGVTPVSARKEQLKLDIVEPWKNLIRTAYAAAARINATDNDGDGLSAGDKQQAATRANEQAQGLSWLILLDFADYLSLHLPRVWSAVVEPSRRGDLVTDSERRLFDWLHSTTATGPGSGWQLATPSFAISLRDALRQIRASESIRTGLERKEVSYPAHRAGDPAWPPFLYLLAGVRQTGGAFQADGIHASLAAFTTVTADPLDVEARQASGTPSAADTAAALLDKLVQLVVTAIDTTAPPAAAPPLPFAVGLRDALQATNGDPGWFVMRCVYVRGDCGPLHPPTLSPPSQRCQLAGFFDPDAPARPIRIALPMDTTPAGMRRFNKNTAFIMSDILCGQVQRAKGLGLGDLIRSVLPFPLHKPLDVGDLAPCAANGTSIGMICSLSIPIITVCALLLLMIIVSLLDLIFRWLPWFAICFPVPQLKAKR